MPVSAPCRGGDRMVACVSRYRPPRPRPACGTSPEAAASAASGDVQTRRSIARFVLALLFFVFDLVTVLPAAAACYLAKRAVRLNVFPGIDMLPDEMIEGSLAWLQRWARRP